MDERKMYPNINPNMHLYINDKQLWGVVIPTKSQTVEVVFDDDTWIHENQFEFDKKSYQWPEKLFEFKDVGSGQADAELKIGEKEELIIQNIFQIAKSKFILFPVSENGQVKRGLIVELGDKLKNEKPTVKKTSAPPKEMIKPSILPQTNKSSVTDILFCGTDNDC